MAKKQTPKTKAGRKYDNTSRAVKSAQTQMSIIEALVALLVERRGGEVQLHEVAKRTGITERTIFRFFKDKQSLHEAMDTYLFSYLQTGVEQMKSMDFIGFAKNAYKLFDQYEALTMAYVLSPFGHEARAIFRKKLNQAMIAQIKKERKLDLNRTQMTRVALITSLVNAKIWYDIKMEYGFTGEEMSAAIEWALKTLLDHSEDKV